MIVVSKSSRLKLCQFSSADVDGFYQLNNDPMTLQYTGDSPFKNKAAVAQFIRDYEHYDKFGFGRWSIYLNENQTYVGFCGLRFSEKTKEVDLGFRILSAYWNQGLATESARLALELGFKKFCLESIVGRAMNSNKASHVVLKKLGFEFEQSFKEDENVWNQYRLYTRSTC